MTYKLLHYLIASLLLNPALGKVRRNIHKKGNSYRLREVLKKATHFGETNVVSSQRLSHTLFQKSLLVYGSFVPLKPVAGTSTFTPGIRGSVLWFLEGVTERQALQS